MDNRLLLNRIRQLSGLDIESEPQNLNRSSQAYGNRLDLGQSDNEEDEEEESDEDEDEEEEDSDTESIRTEMLEPIIDDEPEDELLPALPLSYFLDSEESDVEENYPVGRWYTHVRPLVSRNVQFDEHSWREPMRERIIWPGRDSSSDSSSSDESDYFSDF